MTRFPVEPLFVGPRLLWQAGKAQHPDEVLLVPLCRDLNAVRTLLGPPLEVPE